MTVNSKKTLNNKQKKNLNELLFLNSNMEGNDSLELEYNTFVIIDAAKDESIPYYLDGLEAEYACLLNNDESKRLRSVAPYLVRLESDTDVTEWYLTKLYGKGVGFAFQTRQSLETMRVHWKNQFRSKIPESNEKGFFRFYDPNVLSAYLPILDEKDDGALSRFTNHCESFLVESSNKIYLQRFWKKNEDDDTLSNEELCLDQDSSSEETEQKIA